MGTRTLDELSAEGLTGYRFPKTEKGTTIVASSVSWKRAATRIVEINGEFLASSGRYDDVNKTRLRVGSGGTQPFSDQQATVPSQASGIFASEPEAFLFQRTPRGVAPGYQERSPLSRCQRRSPGGAISFSGSSMQRCHLGINVTVTNLLRIRWIVTQFLRKQSHISFIVRQRCKSAACQVGEQAGKRHALFP